MTLRMKSLQILNFRKRKNGQADETHFTRLFKKNSGWIVYPRLMTYLHLMVILSIHYSIFEASSKRTTRRCTRLTECIHIIFRVSPTKAWSNLDEISWVKKLKKIQMIIFSFLTFMDTFARAEIFQDTILEEQRACKTSV